MNGKSCTWDLILQFEGTVASIDPNQGAAVLSSSVPTLSCAVLDVYILILGDLWFGLDVSFTNQVFFVTSVTDFHVSS